MLCFKEIERTFKPIIEKWMERNLQNNDGSKIILRREDGTSLSQS